MREFDEVQGVGNDVSHEKRTFHEWWHRMEHNASQRNWWAVKITGGP